MDDYYSKIPLRLSKNTFYPKAKSQIKYIQLSKLKLIDIFTNMLRIKSKGKNVKYFKQKDYTKKELNLDLNFNHNFRKEITPTFRSKCFKPSEEFSPDSNFYTKTKYSYFPNKNSIRHNISNLTEVTKSYQSDTSKNLSPNLSPNEKFKYNSPNKIFPKIYKHKLSNEIKSDINNLINKINTDYLTFKEFEAKQQNEKKSKLEQLKDYINQDFVGKKMFKLRFANIHNMSKDNIGRDNMNEKNRFLSFAYQTSKNSLNKTYNSDELIK